jgi:hypothetical protein
VDDRDLAQRVEEALAPETVFHFRQGQHSICGQWIYGPQIFANMDGWTSYSTSGGPRPCQACRHALAERGQML